MILNIFNFFLFCKKEFCILSKFKFQMLMLIVSRISIFNIMKIVYIFISFILFDDFNS